MFFHLAENLGPSARECHGATTAPRNQVDLGDFKQTRLPTVPLWRGATFIFPALAYAPGIRNPASPSLRLKRSASKGSYSNAPQPMRRVRALGEGTRDEFFNQQ